MLIISKFRDYYDSVAKQTGIDKTIVYNRLVNAEKYEKCSDYKRFFTYIKRKESLYSQISFILNFCGVKFFGCLIRDAGYKNDTVEVFYGMDVMEVVDPYYKKDTDIINFIKENHEKKWDEFNLKYKSPVVLLVYEYNEVYDNGRTFAREEENARSLLSDLGDHKDRDIKGSCFIIENPKLDYLQFYKIKDHFTCFQEIQSYISGVLGTNNKELVKIEDKYKLEQHGMGKWSFRNPKPPKRKQKKK